jgi:TPR repeat protein
MVEKIKFLEKLRSPIGIVLCVSLGFLTTLTLSNPSFAIQNDSQALGKYRKGDFLGAIRLWAPMAIGGNPEAQFYIGDMYQNGLGVKETPAVARMLYIEAANRGYLIADRALAEIYFTGNGVPIDMEKALQYYWSAGIKGDHISQYHLGRFYALGVEGGAEGQGRVEKNEIQAYAWLDRAVYNGNKLAGPLLVTLHRTLDDNQRAQAKLLSDNLETGAQKWVPTPLNNTTALALLTPFTKPLPANQQTADSGEEAETGSRIGSNFGQSRQASISSNGGIFKGQWQLHLGSHRNEASAIQAGKHLERIAPNSLRGKRWATLLANSGTYKAKFYRLRMGGYPSFERATVACEDLILKGISCMVVEP